MFLLFEKLIKNEWENDRKSKPRAKKVPEAQVDLGKPKPKNRPAQKPKTIFQKISNWFNS
jgi:hypothetical protein